MDVLNYWPLFLIFIIAWMVPLLLSWMEISKVPAVIVEIIMGVIIGPYVLDFMADTPYMDFLASTGFLILIFLAGLEIDVNRIRTSFPRGRIRMIDLVSNSLLLSIFIYGGSLLLALPFGVLMNRMMGTDVVFIMLLMPTVALSIIVPIVKADGEINRKFGQIMLMVGAIATIMSIILISLYSGVLRYGFQAEMLLFLIIFVVFLIIYQVGKRLIRVHTFQKLQYRLEHAASQIRVRGAVALLLFFVIVAHMINIELVMGAFVAGILLSLFVNKERSALLFKLDGMSYGFFIPIFFIMVGVNLDLSALRQFGESIPFIITLVTGFFITQVIPAMVMAKIFGWKKAMAGGILLTARMGLAIATAQVGLSLGIITTAENAGIVTAAILTSLISPMAYKLFNSKGEHYYQVLLFGGSRASLFLAERFTMHKVSCLTILQNRDMLHEFEKKNLTIKFVDKIGKDVVDSLRLRTADLVIMLTELKQLNLELTHYIKHDLNHNRLITRKYSALDDKVDSHMDTKLIDKDEILANHIEDMIMRPDSVASLSVSFDNYRVEEIHITNKEIHRKLVKEVAFPRSGSLVIQRRNGEIFIPHGDTHLLLGDVITVIGNSSALAEFRRIFEEQAK